MMKKVDKHPFIRDVMIKVIAIVAIALPMMAIADAPQREGLLWRIEKAGLSDSFLLGTMHTDHPGVLRILDRVTPYLKKSQCFLMEVEMTPEASQIIVSSMHLPQGEQLKPKLSPQLWTRLNTVAEKRGISSDNLNAMRPWAVAALLSIPSSDPTKMLDNQLHRLAVENNLIVSGLEFAEEQMRVFSVMSEREQLQMLDYTVVQIEQGAMNRMLDAMRTAYIKDDLGALEALAEQYPMVSDTRLNQQLKNRLLDERNIRMANRSVASLIQQSCFIAVGALHLPGKTGMINQLRMKGYRVTPVAP